jgi:PAS domain S-box-containing protein
VAVPPDHASTGERAEDPPDRAASRDEERLYHSLFERNPLPMWVFDTESLRFLAVNPAAEEKYGYSASEFLRMSIEDIRPPEDIPRLRRTVAGASGAGIERASGIWRHRARDGRILWVEIFSHAVTFGGRPARMVLSHDVSERIALEESLRESEHRYRALFDQSPLGVLYFDRDLRVLACNLPLAEALGFDSCDSLIGFDLASLQDQRVLPTLRQAAQGERSLYEGPYRATHRPVRAWIAAHVSPLFDDGGAVDGGVAIIEDITVRKLAEAKLARQARALEQVNQTLRQRTEQLEAALASRSRLYAAMNHELRTPISAIMLHNDLLLGGAVGELNRDQAQSVQYSQRAAEHLLELVQDMLDLARIEAGRLVIVREETSPRDLIEDLTATIRPLAEQRGSSLELRLPLSTPSVVTDPKRVRQIVLNLVSNALKFGAGHPVRVECEEAEGGGVTIAVSDQGRGIATADRERIFDDFVQVGDAAEGSGLGLSISRRLATLLGGSLDVESEPGSGSTFRLRLPAEAPIVVDNALDPAKPMPRP